MASHVVYDAVLGSGNALKQVLSSQYSGGVQVIAGRASGAPDPSELFVNKAAPMVSFVTADVAGVLGILSITAGLYVAAGTITVPWNQRTNGGTFASGSAHFSLTGTDALIIPKTIAASQGDEAVVAGVEVHFLSSDGFTAPVSPNVNQALASQSFNVQHAFGPAYFGGSAIAECIGWTVDPGLTVTKSSHDGGAYPIKAYIEARDPTIDLVFEDLDAANTFGAMSAAMTSCAVYGRKRSPGGVYVSAVTTAHLKFSFAGGITATQTLEASGVNAGRGIVRLFGKALTASAASAVP